MSRADVSAFAAALALAACGGVSYRLDEKATAPATVAVLPMQGPAAPGLRAAARQLLQSRLAARGYRTPELAWIDRVLSEHGWLRDPDRFVLDAKQLPAMLAALQVDAAVVGDGFDETSFNVLVLRRHSVGGRMAIVDTKGREFWSADHGASTLGGFLLTSGQVFSELRAQGEHATPMSTLALVDELVEDVIGTLPARELMAPPASPPAVTAVTKDVVGEQVVVRARATAGASVRFDLVPHVSGVPMVAAPDGETFVGRYDVPAGTDVQRVVVRARDAWGREAAAEASR